MFHHNKRAKKEIELMTEKVPKMIANRLPTWWSRNLNETDRILKRLVYERFSKEQINDIFAAKAISYEQHNGEKRAGGEDYIIHPYRIAISLILEFTTLNHEVIIVALLHDLLENTKYPPDMLREKFGENVLKNIYTLTREGKHPKTGEKIQDIYFQKIIDGGDDTILTKIADKLDNIRDALNHPKEEKRKLYVRETYEVFYPLALHLKDKTLVGKTINLLQEAIENHSFFQKHFPLKYYFDVMSDEFDSLGSGDFILYNDLSKMIPEIDKHLDIFLLFNPSLSYWLNIDYVQIVKISADFETVITNVCYKIIRKIEKKDIKSLISIASISSIFAEHAKYKSWNKVIDQLRSIVHILTMPSPPTWLMPVMKDLKLILLVIHSRLFVPANLDSPLWQGGSVIGLKDKELYKGIAGDDKTAEEWGRTLYLLLCHREALWRYQTGYGSFMRANYVLDGLKLLASNTLSFEELLSMRFLAEYLDMTVTGAITEDKLISGLCELWKGFEKDKENHRENLLKERPNRKKLIYDTYQNNIPSDISSLEIIGFDKIKSLCKEHCLVDNVNHLLKIMSDTVTEGKNADILWVVFDVREIFKRERYFIEALTCIQKNTSYDDLRRIGIDIHESVFQKNRIFTIAPSKWLALKNRFPEIKDTNVKKISQKDFSATAIFDTLLLDELIENNISPFFMPRVFRVLDIMADYDPFNVQEINVYFDSTEKIKNFKIHLPIPKNMDECERQEERKRILSRFIATTIFNYAVTIGVYSAFVDCAPPLNEREKYCYTNSEIEKEILSYASDFKYIEAYGNFVQNFNFKAFDIKSSTELTDDVPFTEQDMCKGTYLGIDIGGSDTKICLAVKGKSEKLLKTLPTFEDKKKKIEIAAFCDRLIFEISSSLQDSNSWEKIDGVGISWPGAVRNSKIVGFSATLGGLKLPNINDTLNHKSLPQEIQSVDIAGTFFNQLKEKFPKISNDFVTIIENDGNAEAFGNYCTLRTNSTQQTGGRLVIKLGTSLAGGHIDLLGAISSHQVAEFSKVIMDFNVKPSDVSKIEGPARDFVSSKGVRNLSRSFHFNNELLFGPLSGRNESDDDLMSRIEAVELGGLLLLWDCIDDDSLEDNRFLNELIESDNGFSKTRYDDLSAKLIDLLKQADSDIRKCLSTYIKNSGKRQYEFSPNKTKDSTDINLQIWRLGVNRLHLLCTGKELHISCKYEEIPQEFNFEVLTKKVLGTVALFSQMGLHIAHLIVLLYNIYRKERFKEVILTGGVLSSISGALVKRQTEAFLLKYYDKVYGSGKNIELDSIVLAHNAVPAVVGPYGAAMIANRMHKMNGLAQMRKIIDFKINSLMPGDAVSFDTVFDSIKSIRCKENDIRNYLDRLVSESILLPKEFVEDIYIKTLST